MQVQQLRESFPCILQGRIWQRRPHIGALHAELGFRPNGRKSSSLNGCEDGFAFENRRQRELIQDYPAQAHQRSEEHTSELQSRENLVCRLLLEKKKKKNNRNMN